MPSLFTDFYTQQSLALVVVSAVARWRIPYRVLLTSYVSVVMWVYWYMLQDFPIG